MEAVIAATVLDWLLTGWLIVLAAVGTYTVMQWFIRRVLTPLLDMVFPDE